MSQKKITLYLNCLHCYFIEEANHDDVYLKYNGKKIWPKRKRQQAVKMDTSTPLDVEISGLSVGQEIVIELWDFDWLSSNDLLGVFKLEVPGLIGTYATDMTLNLAETQKAKYTLEWEVF